MRAASLARGHRLWQAAAAKDILANHAARQALQTASGIAALAPARAIVAEVIPTSTAKAGVIIIQHAAAVLALFTIPAIELGKRTAGVVVAQHAPNQTEGIRQPPLIHRM